MSYVALFRNLNLGHPSSPTGAALVDAFGGPSVASSFQINGTRDAGDTARPRTLNLLCRSGGEANGTDLSC